MHNRLRRSRPLFRVAAVLGFCLLAAITLGQCGCTTGFSEWVHNGFKVGPNYCKPPVYVAKKWIDANSPLVRQGDPNLAAWWEIFNDPKLNGLVQQAYERNFSLRAAGFAVLQAKANLAIAVGNLLPQSQSFDASYTRRQISVAGGGGEAAGLPTTGTSSTVSNLTPGASVGSESRFSSTWATNLNMSWELDFWGLFRRAVEAADASLDASIENYDDMLVILLSNVATQYVEFRTLQRRIDLAEKNVEQQIPLVAKLKAQYDAGKTDLAAYYQLLTSLKQTEALIPPLKIALRQANDQLCLLLGIPMRDLEPELGKPTVPVDPDHPEDGNLIKIPLPHEEENGKFEEAVVVDIPAKLLLRRPDVRKAERDAAAQNYQIGVAEAEMYPHIGINGNIGLAASKISTLFSSKAWTGSIGPSMTWNILNYGRLLANVRLQDYTFQSLVATYQNKVLTANQEAEDAMAGYLNSLVQAEELRQAAYAAVKVTNYLLIQEKIGKFGDYGRLFTVQQTQVQTQDTAAQAEGNIALNLILLYKAMGGGWQIRLKDIGPNGKCLPRTENHDILPVMIPEGVPLTVPAEPLPAPTPVGMQGMQKAKSIPAAILGEPESLPPVLESLPAEAPTE